MLPMCMGCRAAKPVRKPILVGSVNQVEKERERQKAKQEKKAKVAAGKARKQARKVSRRSCDLSGSQIWASR